MKTIDDRFEGGSHASYDGGGFVAPAGQVAPIDTPEPNKPTVVDLFAGAGGFSLGAVQAKFTLAGALEWNRHAAATYKLNIDRSNGSPVQVISESILDVSPSDAVNRWKLKDGTCDVVVGGPPCQGFSSHRLKDAGVDDPRNRLLGRYFEYVETLRPRAFLVENVPGMLWPRHAAYLEAFYSAADKAGYDVKSAVILNARDFGVPQSRRRAFILGIDRQRPFDIVWPPAPQHVAPETAEPERAGRPDWLTAKAVFDPVLPDDKNDVHMNHSKALTDLFRETPANGGSRRDSGRVLKCHAGHNGHHDVYGRIDPSKPAPTMTTACINPSKGRFVHPTEHHGITVRQAARIQTFPEAFEFTGGLIASGEQIGNAVPVEMAKRLLEILSDAMNSKTKRPQED